MTRIMSALGAALLAVLCLAGCGGNDTYNPAVSGPTNPAGNPSFTMNVTPASQQVLPGETASYSVSLSGQNGFNAPVSLSVSGLPAEATAAFNPQTVTLSGEGAQSTLTVTTTGFGSVTGTVRSPGRQGVTPGGTSTLTITATGGGVTVTKTVTLIVSTVD